MKKQSIKDKNQNIRHELAQIKWLKTKEVLRKTTIVFWAAVTFGAFIIGMDQIGLFVSRHISSFVFL